MSKLKDLIEEFCPNGVEYKTIKETVGVNRGKRLTKSQLSDLGKYEVYHGSKDSILGRYSQCNAPADTIIVVNTGGIGGVKYLEKPFWCSDGSFWLGKDDRIISKFLYYYLIGFEGYFYSQKRIGGVPTIDRNVVEQVEIPLPPLSVQEEIVRILDNYTNLAAELQAELQARQEQYEYYRNKLLSFNKIGGGTQGVIWKKMSEISLNMDKLRKPITSSNRKTGPYPYYGASGIVDYVEDYLFDGDYLLVSEDGANLAARVYPIAFSISGKNWVNNHAHVLKFETYNARKYVEYYINSIDISQYISEGAQPKLTQAKLNIIPIPLPSTSEQNRIVEILDKFELLVNDLSQGLPAEIAAVQEQYEYYRNKLLTFNRISA